MRVGSVWWWPSFCVRLLLPALLGTLALLICNVGTAFASLPLPDERAWELVSPVEKNGGYVSDDQGQNSLNGGGMIQTSPDGEAITYSSLNAFSDPQAAPVASQYVSTRNPSGGWLTQNISSLTSSQVYVSGGEGAPFRAFSTDLSSGLVFGGARGGSGHNERPVEGPPLVPSAPVGYEDYYVYQIPGGVLQPMLTAPPNVSPGAFGLNLLGSTPNLEHVIVRSETALTQNAVQSSGKSNLYEWNQSTGQFAVVNVLPGNSESSPEGTLRLGGEGADYAIERAVSPDGSRVVWSAVVGGIQNLYVRLNADAGAEARTVQADAPLGGGEFLAASSDDRAIFFDDFQPLTAGSSPFGTNDLYLFEPEAGAVGHLVDLTADSEPEGAEVLGVLGASADGSYLYFVADGRLDAATQGMPRGTCTGGASPPGSTCYLYLWHRGWKEPKLVAALSGNDQSGASFPFLGVAFDWENSPGVRTARVSQNGLSAVFMSEEAETLVGYDNKVSKGTNCGASPQGPLPAKCQEVFLYEASESEADPGHLRCVSCNPSGARPSGPSGIPGGDDFSLLRAEVQSRVLSEGEHPNRVFFDSDDGLVPSDTNGVEDVYEYENGSVSLLSDGTNPAGATFVEASENGDDVFFLTAAQLVTQDTDQLTDLYDARAPHTPGERVGFSTSAPTVCEEEACRAPASSAPAFSAPASAILTGSGNIAPYPPAKQVVTKPVVKVKPKHNTKRKRRANAKAKHVKKAAIGRRADKRREPASVRKQP